MIIIPTIIERIATRKDNTLSISLATNELTPSKVGEIMFLHNRMSYTAIKPENFTKNELDIVDSLKLDESIGKSPSQRLRGVLYRSFEQDSEGFNNFEAFYVNKMENMIDHFKSKLS